MTEEVKNAMETLGAAASGGDPSKVVVQDGGIDWKDRCEEAERKLASALVEQGRVKKLDAELKERDAKIADLERKVALGELPDNLKEVPDDIKETARIMSEGAAHRAVAGVDKRLAQLEQDRQADKAARLEQLASEFVQSVNAKFPGFLAGIKEGGNLKAAWDEYQRYNAASVVDAFNRLDAATFMYHIKRFYESNGVDPSGGRDPNAAPDPRAMGGGAGASPQQFGQKKIYTPDEWEREYDSLQDDYEAGRISPKDYAAKRDTLVNAHKEGRVKAP